MANPWQDCMSVRAGE